MVGRSVRLASRPAGLVVCVETGLGRPFPSARQRQQQRPWHAGKGTDSWVRQAIPLRLPPRPPQGRRSVVVVRSTLSALCKIHTAARKVLMHCIVPAFGWKIYWRRYTLLRGSDRPRIRTSPCVRVMCCAWSEVGPTAVQRFPVCLRSTVTYHVTSLGGQLVHACVSVTQAA